MKRISRFAILCLLLLGVTFHLGFPAPTELPPHLFVQPPYSMQTENSICLFDGRTLGYAEYGDPNGFPVFYFHGGQESRLSGRFMDHMARQLHIRLIAPERPGIGLSTPQPQRQFLDWAQDISQLADSLGTESFSVFGLSGGAPHVLACAYTLPHRIRKVAVVSGTAPYNYKGKLKGSWFPVRLVHWFAAAKTDKNLRTFMDYEEQTLRETPGKRLRQLQKYLPKPDRELLKAHPEYGISFLQGSLEAFRQGNEAVVQEWRLYVRDWGFELKDIRVPIQLWYGDQDKMTPKYRGFYLEKELPQAHLSLLPNEGHFSLIRNHQETILRELLPESLTGYGSRH